MDLQAYQRAFMRMSFAAEPGSEDLAALGSPARALLYRHMIRTRLLGMAKVAFKGCLEALGEEAFGLGFARYLASEPPRSPLIRDVIADFAPFVRAEFCSRAEPRVSTVALSESLPFLADLLRFEESKWRLAYELIAPREQAGLRELDFEGAPSWNASLRLLSLRYPVHTFTGAREQTLDLRAESCELLMYRPPGSDEVRWYNADPFFAELLSMSRESPRSSLGELVPAVAEKRGAAVDQGLLESLASSLTLALERGVLLGVLDRS